MGELSTAVGKAAHSRQQVLTEREWQNYVTSLARMCGWRVSHFRGAWSSRGFRTPVQYDGQGFPDLVMVHPERSKILWVELKAGKNKLSKEQECWRDWLRAANQDWREWRPGDEAEVEKELSDGRIRA